MPLQSRDSRFATMIADALRHTLGDTRRAVKTAVRWTGASERTVKNWLAGVTGPSGEHLIDLIRESDAVAEAVLMTAGRHDIVDARRLVNAHGGLAQMLAMVDALRVDGVTPIDKSTAVAAKTLITGKNSDPTSDPTRDPVNDPARNLVRYRLNARQLWFLQQLTVGRSVRAMDLRRQWAVSEKTAKRDIAVLKSKGLIEFVGSFKTGNYRCISR
jgi:hypothetical protein